jgi:hypothetical protein
VEYKTVVEQSTESGVECKREESSEKERRKEGESESEQEDMHVHYVLCIIYRSICTISTLNRYKRGIGADSPSFSRLFLHGHSLSSVCRSDGSHCGAAVPAQLQPCGLCDPHAGRNPGRGRAASLAGCVVVDSVASFRPLFSLMHLVVFVIRAHVIGLMLHTQTTNPSTHAHTCTRMHTNAHVCTRMPNCYPPRIIASQFNIIFFPFSLPDSLLSFSSICFIGRRVNLIFFPTSLLLFRRRAFTSGPVPNWSQQLSVSSSDSRYKRKRKRNILDKPTHPHPHHHNTPFTSTPQLSHTRKQFLHGLELSGNLTLCEKGSQFSENTVEMGDMKPRLLETDHQVASRNIPVHPHPGFITALVHRSRSAHVITNVPVHFQALCFPFTAQN